MTDKKSNTEENMGFVILYVVVAIMISSLISTTPQMGDNPTSVFILGMVLRVVVTLVVIVIIELIRRQTT